MEIPDDLRHRIDHWDTLSRWERSELGRDLRRLGLSYGEIQRLIEVKKGTLATWCRDIALSDEQKAAIMQRTGSQAGIPKDTNRRRRLEIQEIRRLATAAGPELMNDSSWVAGVVLYWCEGSKTRNHLSVANADPVALTTFIGWTRTFIDPSTEFVLQLHLHEGNDDGTSQQWWRAQLGLPQARFHKTFIKPPGTGHRKNHLIHGVCTVKVTKAADAWQTTMAWIEFVRSNLANLSPATALVNWRSGL